MFSLPQAVLLLISMVSALPASATGAHAAWPLPYAGWPLPMLDNLCPMLDDLCHMLDGQK